MRKLMVLGAGFTLALAMTAANAATLDDVKKKGYLDCGISTGVAGFAFLDDKGNWQGFDPALCKAVAAAIFGDSSKVKYTTTTGKTRFTVLRSGEVDMLARNTTWTYVRDVDLKLEFVGVNYYDGQGFMVPKKLGVKSAKELNGASVCIQTGTTTELNLADYFRTNAMKYEPVPIETNEEARKGYLSGRCDVYTTDASGLAATRSTLDDPSAHALLPEIISKEPLGPLVRHGDSEWADVVRWTLNAMIIAEELGIDSKNVDALITSTNNPEVKRLMGAEGDYGPMMGLPKEWAYNIIKQVGNYSEVYEAFIGASTPIGLPRGLNALWTKGGILYAPPFR